MSILRTRGKHIDPDVEVGKVVKAARLVMEGKSQKEIAEFMEISASTVSRLLSTAQTQKILRIEVVPPPLTILEEEMQMILGRSGVQKVYVVPSGEGRNVQNLGGRGATVVVNAILSLLNSKPGDEPIRIVMSCGTTVRQVMDEVVYSLEDYCIRDKNPINRMLRILPSTLVSDFELDAVYPHTAVTIFWNSLRYSLGDRLKISAAAPQLPKDFYEKYPADNEARRRALAESGLEAVLHETRQADIFILGAGTTADPSYQKVHKALGVTEDNINSDPSETPEIVYTPITPDGTEHEETEGKIVGIKMTELRDIRNTADRYVIVVSGGSEKRISLQTAFRNPCFNILVTDADAAEEAVRRWNEAARPGAGRTGK